MKKTILVFAIIAVAIFGFVNQPVRHNGTFTLVQLSAMAGEDSEGPDDEFPPPPLPPGMPQPPPDSIPPYVIPSIYYSNR